VGIKTHCRSSIVLATFMFTIFGTYAYSFFMGSIWIYHAFDNTTFHRPYTSGDILSVFFGVFFGIFSIGMATPNLKAVAEGKAAGKMAYDIIDRKPMINQDDPSSSKIAVKGKIEFRNVSFVYPSRPEQKILKNFNATFEIGKTTAIVGPSGSGKSTVVQLLERFYNPSEGDVFIDD
jgi:ATP-binding cassette subfamily B (MDR/TAP) protein 1